MKKQSGKALTAGAERQGVQEILDRLCRSAAEICGCEVAAVSYNRGGRTRLIASFGVATRYRTFEYDKSAAPFKPRERVVMAKSDPRFNKLGVPLGIEDCRFFLRLPVSITPDHATSLIVLSSEARKPPTPRRMKLLDLTATLIAQILKQYFKLLDDDAVNVSAITALADIKREIVEGTGLAALVDGKMNVCAVSASLGKVLGRKPRDVVGSHFKSLNLRASEALGFMFGHALETKLSPPPFEIAGGDGRGGHSSYLVSVTPVSPTDDTANYLYVTLDNVTSANRQEEAINAAYRKHRAALDPASSFLLDTLVSKRNLRERNGVGYLTVSVWRQPMKTYQIGALKALKDNLPPDFTRQVAERMAKEIESFIGLRAFKVIVPMPCSHSRSESCLSAEIARALGAISGLPVVRGLRIPPGGASHPKKNAKRLPMSLAETVPGPVLLVDDVATSGAHIEEAVKILRPGSGSVMAVAWIGGASS